MKTCASVVAVAAFTALAAAQSSSTTASASSAAAAPTEVTDCHFHGDTPFCFAGEDEWEVDEDLDEDELPDAYTDCHSHGADELHCSSPEGTTLYAAAAEDSHSSESDHDHSHSSSSSNSTSVDEITSVSGCHAHDDTVYCFVGEDEWEVETDVDAANAPEEYTDCHAHGEDELHCASPEDVTLAATTEHSEEHEEGEAEDHTHSTNESGETTTEETTTEEASGENLASTAQISSALVMLGAAVGAVCFF